MVPCRNLNGTLQRQEWFAVTSRKCRLRACDWVSFAKYYACQIGKYRLIALTPVVTKFFVTNITLWDWEYKVEGLKNSKMLGYCSHCRETALQGALVLAKSGRLELRHIILRTL